VGQNTLVTHPLCSTSFIRIRREKNQNAYRTAAAVGGTSSKEKSNLLVGLVPCYPICGLSATLFYRGFPSTPPVPPPAPIHLYGVPSTPPAVTPPPFCGLPLFLSPLRRSYVLPRSSLSTGGSKQSVYHLHTWETFYLASEARSTPLGHVRAHVSTRLDRGQT